MIKSLYLELNRHVTEYMAPLVSSLQQLGYKDGDNLFGAPYDFRYGLAAEGHPCEVGSRFLQDLKQLIENASMANGGKPVIVLSHSLGSLFALHLLHRSPPYWRRKFVKHLVTLSAPWAGTAQEMLTFASGYSLDVPLVNPVLVRSEQRSSESNLWLLPSSKHFGHKPLVVTDHGRTYSSFDIPQFLKDIGFQEGVQPYVTRILPLVRQLPAPMGVPVTCIVGGGIKTVETLFYGSDGFDRQPNIVYGDGDGTVNTVSLLALQSEWSNASEKQEVKVIQMPLVTHTSILKEEEALRKINEEIMLVNSLSLTSPA